MHDPPYNESDTRAKLINPALYGREWVEDDIRREETAGAVELIDGKPRRRSQGRVDYTLRIMVGTAAERVAVAVVEAKAESLPPGHGLDQAKAYARCKRLNVPFAFASNGHQFVEFDDFTRLTTAPKPMAEFPTPAELRRRYEAGMGFGLQEPVAEPLLVPYSPSGRRRRYYQDAAIRAVFEKIAQCRKAGEPPRALLSLATGAGKTFLSVQLLRRLADAGQLGRALFVCDRDELRTQALTALQNEFGNDVAAVSTRDPQRNARIVVATYQTLGVDTDDDDASFLVSNYPENYFSHVVIDECHRSAWGKWSLVLTRNAEAVQIGLTATPRQLEIDESKGAEAKRDAKITADNLHYFGEPVYEYSLAQGIEDGYLAFCEIVEGRVNLDNTGITLDQIMARNPVDAITGRPITRDELKALYEATSFEQRVVLPDRVLAMCRDLFRRYVETGGPEQKSIVFCASDRHADDVAVAMNNLYAEWCRDNGRKPLDAYAFKCTAAGGKDYLPELRGAKRSHFVATTVDLLSTGVDVPCLRNVVFFRYVGSPISLHQMVGRGTRIDDASGKLMFRIHDYTGATDLLGAGFVTAPPESREPGTGEIDPPPRPPIISVEGFEVVVSEGVHSVPVEIDGQLTKIGFAEYKQRLAARLIAEVADAVRFRERWIVPDDRRTLLRELPEGERSARLVQALDQLHEFDLYDVLADLGWAVPPRTRRARADVFLDVERPWLAGLPKRAADVLEAYAGQFAVAGTDGLESREVFRTPAIRKAGGLDALREVGEPGEVILDAKARLFAV